MTIEEQYNQLFGDMLDIKKANLITNSDGKKEFYNLFFETIRKSLADIVTFLIYTFAIKKWQNSEKGKASKPLTGIKGICAITGIFLASLGFSFGTNYIGYGGQMSLLFWTTTLVFGLSLAGNILNAMKLTMQWPFWLVYNIVQTVKAVVQGNFANVGKYIFYIINSIAAIFVWEND